MTEVEDQSKSEFNLICPSSIPVEVESQSKFNLKLMFPREVAACVFGPVAPVKPLNVLQLPLIIGMIRHPETNVYEIQCPAHALANCDPRSEEEAEA